MESSNPIVNRIVELFTRIRKTLETSGLAASSCVYRRDKLEEATDDALLHAEQYLIGFEAGFIGMYKKARALVPESVWQMYKNLETKGTWEQGQLSDARRIMWVEWKKRPNLLRKYNVVSKGQKSKRPRRKDRNSRTAN